MINISERPFTMDDNFRSTDIIDPAWVDLSTPRILTDVYVEDFVIDFLVAAKSMTKGEFGYGTVYGVWLDGSPRKPGQLHYDLGEYSLRGADRFVSTWRSDGVEIGNIFVVRPGIYVQAPNLRVTRFNEGTDLHFSPEVPGNATARGMFLSATFYRWGEPANLDCPRLAPLRNRGPFAELATQHAPVTRVTY